MYCWCYQIERRLGLERYLQEGVLVDGTCTTGGGGGETSLRSGIGVVGRNSHSKTARQETRAKSLFHQLQLFHVPTNPWRRFCC